MMKSPIFVYEPATLYVFSTKEKALAFIEAVDVENGVYTEVYDSEGYILEVFVVDRNDVAIESLKPPKKNAQSLHELLHDYLQGIKGVSKEWLANASLRELVNKSLDYKTS
jgi:hypothetical protein